MTNEEAINYLKISMAIGEDDDSRQAAIDAEGDKWN